MKNKNNEKMWSMKCISMYIVIKLSTKTSERNNKNASSARVLSRQWLSGSPGVQNYKNNNYCSVTGMWRTVP